MKPTFKIFPRVRSIKQNGEIPFYIRITINQQSRWFSLHLSFPFPDVIKYLKENKLSLKPFPDKIKHWDEKECCIKPYPNVNKFRLKEVNQGLEKVNTRARSIVHNHNIIDKPLTLDDFETELWTIRKIDGNKSFYEFAENEIAYMTEMKAPAETLRTFSSLISKLKQYEGSLYFNDITLEFLKKYHSFMVNDLNNHENTCSKLFRFMRNMINRAISQNIIKENVFDRFQIKSLPGKREFLSEDELKILEDLNIKGTGTRYLNNVLKYFLFACYTGLRYQDLKKLRFSDLKKGNIDDSEVFFIRITMHKTREEVSVPLIPKAFALVGEPGFQNQKVFRVSVNQLTNRHLKEIITKAKIQKNITFHCARHTFAVHCLELEMPIEVVSALLGHTNLKTTEIYTKILDRRKLYHLSKWK